MSNQEKELLEKFYIGNFDTPKKLNRSTKKVSAADITAIESGVCTIEMIERMAKTLPIFVYRSCITIHGTFGEVSRTSIGGYQNIRQNANGSLEILYSAIDKEKMETMNLYLQATKCGKIHTDSKGHTYTRRFSDINKLKEYCNGLRNLKGLVCSVFAFRYYGEMFVETTILSIKQNSINSFLTIATGLSSTELTQTYESHKAEKEAAQIEYNKKLAEVQEQRRQAEAVKQENLAPLQAKINHLRGFMQPEIGKTYIKAVYVKEQGYCYKFVRFEKAPFGKLKIFFCFNTDLKPVEFKQGEKAITKEEAVRLYKEYKILH